MDAGKIKTPKKMIAVLAKAQGYLNEKDVSKELRFLEPISNPLEEIATKRRKRTQKEKPIDLIFFLRFFVLFCGNCFFCSSVL
jgi:hypothetical protein